MYNQNNKIEIAYGNNSLKEICNEILKQEFIKLFSKGEKGENDKTI